MGTKQKTGRRVTDVSNKIVGKNEVERLIADYSRKDSSIAMNKDLDYLLSEKVIAKVQILSFPTKNENRVDAVIRQYNTHSLMEPSFYHRFTFCIEYSMRHPLLMDEEQRLRSFIDEICPADSKKLIYFATDESLKDKISLTIISSI